MNTDSLYATPDPNVPAYERECPGCGSRSDGKLRQSGGTAIVAWRYECGSVFWLAGGLRRSDRCGGNEANAALGRIAARLKLSPETRPSEIADAVEERLKTPR